MGGEKFAVLLPDTPHEKTMQVADRLRQPGVITPAEVGPDVIEEGRLVYSASLNVTLIRAGETALKPAIKRVDQGLWRPGGGVTKRTGRPVCHVQAGHHASMHSDTPQ